MESLEYHCNFCGVFTRRCFSFLITVDLPMIGVCLCFCYTYNIMFISLFYYLSHTFDSSLSFVSGGDGTLTSRKFCFFGGDDVMWTTSGCFPFDDGVLRNDCTRGGMPIGTDDDAPRYDDEVGNEEEGSEEGVPVRDEEGGSISSSSGVPQAASISSTSLSACDSVTARSTSSVDIAAALPTANVHGVPALGVPPVAARLKVLGMGVLARMIRVCVHMVM